MRFLCFGNMGQIEADLAFFKHLQVEMTSWSYGLEGDAGRLLKSLASRARAMVRDLQELRSMLEGLPFLARKRKELEAWRELRMVFSRRIPALKAAIEDLRVAPFKYREKLR